jgi:hypothetical protein
MRRFLSLGAGLVVVIGTGLLHGYWTQRWQQSSELKAALARMARLPGDLGPWKVREGQLDPAALRQAAVAGSWARIYTRARGLSETAPEREVVAVILLCGRSGPMSVHRPEHCYKGAGYEMVGSITPLHLPAAPGETPAEFWTARFRQQTGTGLTELRIYWSWFTGTTWQAPDSPRLTFARFPALYKLYVVHEINNSQDRSEENSATEFLGRLVPKLTRALSPLSNEEG